MKKDVMNVNYSVSPLGDQALIIDLGHDINIETHQKVKAVSTILDDASLDWVIEIVPAYTTVTVFYDSTYFVENNKDRLPYNAACSELKQVLHHQSSITPTNQRSVEIPVCYGGTMGPDLNDVAETNGLSPEEVIDYHSKGDYLVYMIGFAPGFPYIGGLNQKIATPRRRSPRLKVPPGSVGIAGKQTGVFPIETPGGWQLIGQTPKKLFTPKEASPSLLKPGDKVVFKPISQKEFLDWEDGSYA